MSVAKQVCVTQTVDIPASHRLTIDVPSEVPTGRTIITFTPASDQRSTDRRPDASAKTLVMTEAEEIELINRNAEWLNREALDVLSYQHLDL